MRERGLDLDLMATLLPTHLIKDVNLFCLIKGFY